MRGALKKLALWSNLKRALFLLSFAPFFATSLTNAQEGMATAPTQRKVFLARDNFLAALNENIERINLNDKVSALRLERKASTPKNLDDVLIDFEEDSLFTNPAYTQSIRKAEFERVTHKGMNGRSAFFSSREHGLQIQLPTHLNLAGGGLTTEAGNFSFVTEFNPTASNGEILRRENFVSGKQFLFSIRLLKGRVSVRLIHLIAEETSTDKKNYSSVELKSIDKIRLEQRNLLVFTYNEAQKKLTLTLNEREQEVYPLSKSGTYITFENLLSAPYSLFVRYRGYADNILFSNSIFSENDVRDLGKLTPYGDTYTQRKGVIQSGIFDMRFSQSTVTRIAVSAQSTSENWLEVLARCIDRRFDAELSQRDLPFLPINRIEGAKCRFIQFKSIFTADNAGKTSPLLKSITLEYRENPPPDAPLKPKVTALDSESVQVTISPNTELDVIKGGRYIIYYGHTPQQIEGAVYFTDSPTTGLAHKVPLHVTVTNSIL
ncbi:MAG TPA: hypothetical protein PLY93_12335, partial [Turneriella sp.]|nr:hypothetical protein [Turneriella sp.]